MEKQCINCQSSFNNVTPCNTWVDIRYRKRCWTCSPYGSGNRKREYITGNKPCPKCTILLPIEQFYIRSDTGTGRTMTYCISCTKEYNNNRCLEIKIQLIKMRGGCCSSCGYKKNVYALDFHHRDPEGKLFPIAHTSGITKKILEEIEKCDILCSNCHREHHNPKANDLL